MQEQRSFIEVQFPISKLSKESYKERKAGNTQTLTSLGKWWGRKPLLLVRATILGLLLPSTNNARKDREIFFKLMTMDDDGLWLRKSKAIPLSVVHNRVPPFMQDQLFMAPGKYKRGTTTEQKQAAQKAAFIAMSYDERLEYCDRPEQVDGPSPESWTEINSHLQTSATSIQELVAELGQRRFGRIPHVGDVFCGGGSIPFEAARIGCAVHASDLNPVASLLTWGALNVVGGGSNTISSVEASLMNVFNKVGAQLTEWRIEHNEKNWRADDFLYCVESRCPECGWLVPISPSWVIGEGTKVVARLKENAKSKSFDIDVVYCDSESDLKVAKEAGTVKNSELVCPHCGEATPISTLRGDGLGDGRKLRSWESSDVSPRSDDIFSERLYCIRWVESYRDDDGKEKTRRQYLAVDSADLARERKVISLLHERFDEWQRKGFVPSASVEAGDETSRLMRERGWTYWSHLFTPRQLLVHGLFAEVTSRSSLTKVQQVAALLCMGRLANWDSRLVIWITAGAQEQGSQTFNNQALNTLFNYSNRGFLALDTVWLAKFRAYNCLASEVLVQDARVVGATCDLWITDPPYADAVNYHELSEYFLAWYDKRLKVIFPEWYADSRRALAVRGTGGEFRHSMMECYRTMARNMPDNGLQVVMFTHQDASVWADLALILWAAGLVVSSAWTIATEASTGLKVGNYVQGTVLLVLRKQTSDEVGFLDEITHDIKPEVERQIESMMALDDAEDPNFSDSDYQLAAYAAALRVLTQYKRIEDIDVERELTRERARGEESPIKRLIDEAVKIASNYMIPKALHESDARRRDIWRDLSGDERFYIKGLEVEGHGEARQGVYQEFARGFGISEYKPLLESGKANQTRLKTATEFKSRNLGDEGFGSTLMRQVLAAVREVTESGSVTPAMAWLKDRNNVPDYWRSRETIVDLLIYLTKLPMEHWQEDAVSAKLLAGAVINDHAM
jgi:putative DNA methylase